MTRYKTRYNHIEDRHKIFWVSLGLHHDELPRKTLVKDLSDSHLMRIIIWIKGHYNYYTSGILRLMEEEMEYRAKNYIVVRDYQDDIKYLNTTK